MDTDLDPADLDACLTYRQAFGIAHRRIELARMSMHHGYPDDGRRLDRLRSDVARELGAEAGRRLEVVELAVEDAEAGRRPRW